MLSKIQILISLTNVLKVLDKIKTTSINAKTSFFMQSFLQSFSSDFFKRGLSVLKVLKHALYTNIRTSIY